jgi:hypothetical protein
VDRSPEPKAPNSKTQTPNPESRAIFEEGADLSSFAAVADISQDHGMPGMFDFLQGDSDRESVLGREVRNNFEYAHVSRH